MFRVSKRMEIAASHHLYLDYKSPCQNVHGHNWIVTVHCQAPELNHNDMIVDFTEIKRVVHGQLDHKDMNQVLGDINPTAENIAYWIWKQIPSCYKVEVQESEGNTATYEEYTEEHVPQ